MKAVSFKVPEDLKASIESMAKKNRITVSKLMIQLVQNALQKGESATTMYDSDQDLITNALRTFREQGVERKNGAVNLPTVTNSIIYVPDMYLLEENEASKLLGVNAGIIKRLNVNDYVIVDPAHELVEIARKKVNYHAAQKVKTTQELINVVFQKRYEKPLLLIEKLDPIKLKNFCAEHTDKKVIYILGVQDVKVNRQVSY